MGPMKLRRRGLVERLTERITTPSAGDLVDELAGAVARDDIDRACAVWAAADAALDPVHPGDDTPVHAVVREGVRGGDPGLARL
jgi:hypothetical protein